MTSSREIEQLVQDSSRLLRVRSYSDRTVDTYVRWIRSFLKRSRNKKLAYLGEADVEGFLTHLMEVKRLAPKSRNQAASALAFFFREVVGRDVLRTIPRAKEPKRVVAVLSHAQVRLVLGQLSGKYRLLGGIMYGTGLRVTEAHQLRVKDIDFDLMQITVRDGKGAKDRWVMLPDRLDAALRRQIDRVERQHEEDRTRGAGWACLPHAMARKA